MTNSAVICSFLSNIEMMVFVAMFLLEGKHSDDAVVSKFVSTQDALSLLKRGIDDHNSEKNLSERGQKKL